jgi:hypothetical protein
MECRTEVLNACQRVAAWHDGRRREPAAGRVCARADDLKNRLNELQAAR